MKRRKTLFSLFAGVIFSAALLFSSVACNSADSTLAEKYKDYFYIGATYNADGLNGYERVKKEYNSMTCENEMKWSTLQPNENVFDFTTADKMVAFAKDNGYVMRGHALVWHQAAPAYLENTTDKDKLDSLLKNHIDTVISHFKDSGIYCWDVVNEVIYDTGNEHGDGEEETEVNTVYRESFWYNVFGKEYILKAFLYAREAAEKYNPDLKLYYNDYSLENDPVKRQKAVTMIEYLQEQEEILGVKLIDGVGMQCHYTLGNFNMEELETAIGTFADLGLDVQITELDVSVYEDAEEGYSVLPERVDAYQRSVYKRMFAIFRKYRDAITGVTFWGVCDAETWLDDNEDVGNANRKDHPYLFDAFEEKKSSYYAVMDF